MSSTLLRSRLQWYALATGRLVLRRWQALILVVAVLAPAGASALSPARTLGWPVLMLLSPEHGTLQRYALLCLYQALAVLWALMQQEQIRGGDFMGYARTLPLLRWRVRAIDALVLSVASSPLFLFPLAALAWLCGQEGAVPAWMQGLFIAEFLVLAMFAQLACLERAYLRLVALALANALLAAVPHAGPTGQVVLLAATLPSAWLAARFLSKPVCRPRSAGMQGKLGNVVSGVLPAGVHPAALVSLGYLIREAPAASFGKLVVAAACTAGASMLMALWEYDERINVLAVIVLGAVALVISGLYRDLQMAHRAALPLVAALPLPRHWARKFDHAALLLAGAPFAAVVCATLAWHRPRQLLSALLLGAAFFGLVALLRLPQVHAQRHAVVLSSVIATLWGIVGANALF